MSIPDLINGSFETFGSLFIILSIIKLYKDKEVKGVSWLCTLYFVLWGYWNLYYYPHLGQWISFAGGVLITIMNTIWLLQIYYYKTKNRKDF